MTRKTYSPQFKADAIKRLAKESAAAIAADLGVAHSMIHAWRKKQTSSKKNKPPPKPATKSNSVRDAIGFLRHARKIGRVEDTVYLLSMLALATLEGKL
jgi:transposase-like protein